MKIRIATVLDTKAIVDIGITFLRESAPMKEIDDEYLYYRIADIIQAGIIYLAETKEGEIAGVLASQIVDSLWYSEKEYHELFWYVLPEHRGSSAGMRLLKEFIDYGKNNKEIDRVVLSRLDSSPINKDAYTKRGFIKTVESTWAMEV